MNLQSCLSVSILISIYIKQTQECSQQNISCHDIKTKDGFVFPYDTPPGSKTYISDNETAIAYAVPNTGFYSFSRQVISMDNHSVTTKECRDIQVKHISPDENNFAKETCVDFRITDEIKNPDSTYGYFIIVGVIIVTGFLPALLYWCYRCWKKEPIDLPTCPCLRKGIFLAEGEERGGLALDVLHPEGRRVQEVVAGDSETPHNGDVRHDSDEIPPDGDPRGSGENTEEELESVHVHSVDLADGQTPQSLRLERTLSMERTQQTKNGDIRAPNTNRSSLPRAMYRHFRDDPGEANHDEGRDVIGEMENGRAADSHDAEDHKTEGQPLLSTQRAAIQDFDMQGEAIALVYKHGSDPDRVSRCSTAPETDVESTPNKDN